MAAKKSIPKKSAAHADATERSGTGNRSRSRKHSVPRGSARCSYDRAEPASPGAPRDLGELIHRLNSALDLVETVSIALMQFEAEPTIGSICVTLEHAVVVLGGAHAEVEQFLERRKSRAHDSELPPP